MDTFPSPLSQPSTPLIVSGADDGAGRVGWIISSIDTEKIKDHDNKQ